MKKTLLTLLLILTFFVNCVTKREIVKEIQTDTIRIEMHDTLRIAQIDTIFNNIVSQKTDTIREIQTRVITLRESGDTIREIVNNDVYRYVYRSDSVDKYKSKVDSLQSKIKQVEKEKKTENKDKEVTKKSSSIWKYVTFFIGGAFVLLLAIFLFMKLKNKSI